MNITHSSNASSDELELPKHISKIGHYYLDEDQKVLHMRNKLMNVQYGVLSHLNVSLDSSLTELKKILIVLNKPDELIIPADLMLRVQKIYAVAFGQNLEQVQVDEDSEERCKLLGKIVGKMKSVGRLPENETAIFGVDRREKFLWFLGNAKIERTAKQEEEQVDLSEKKFVPICYSEKNGKEVRPPSESRKIVAQALLAYVLMRRRMQVNPEEEAEQEDTNPQGAQIVLHDSIRPDELIEDDSENE